MTDNEIIKALECCMDGTGRINCENCPLTNEYCRKELPRLALDLINRQQKDIDDLCKVLGRAYQENCFLEASRKSVRTEAIKEFAERLKALDRLDVDVSYGYGREHYTEAIAVNLIDNLVKEMVGDME